jgi:hypothetical protein
MTVSFRAHLDSDLIRIPGGAALVGKDVRVTIEEEADGAEAGGGSGGAVRDLGALDRIAGKIDLDEAAIDELRRRSVL